MFFRLGYHVAVVMCATNARKSLLVVSLFIQQAYAAIGGCGSVRTQPSLLGTLALNGCFISDTCPFTSVAFLYGKLDTGSWSAP